MMKQQIHALGINALSPSEETKGNLQMKKSIIPLLIVSTALISGCDQKAQPLHQRQQWLKQMLLLKLMANILQNLH